MEQRISAAEYIKIRTWSEKKRGMNVMKFHKISRRLAAAMMAGAMMVSMVGMTAFAEGETPITSVDVKKTVTTDGNTYKPNTTFNFEVTSGSAAENYEGSVVYAGEEGGLTAAEGAVFTPAADDTLADSYEATGTLNVNVSVFKRPGVYHYVVKETPSTYDGIVSDESVYDVYLYVYNNADKSAYEVRNVVAVKDGAIAKGGLEFTNNYGAGDNDSTHDITITKVIDGNQADLKAEFSFTVTVSGAEGELYKVVANGETGTLASGQSMTYSLGNNDSIQIYGLSEKDTYSVVENDANTDGYTTTISGDAVTTDNDAGTASGTVSKDGSAVTYTNYKDVTAPTGIAMTIAPYILMVAIAGVFAVLFLRRRNRADY